MPCEEQGSCGSCYAFASAAMLSERHCIKTGELVPLSVEYIISCDTLDFGCDGGHLQNTLTFLQDPVPTLQTTTDTYIGAVEDCPLGSEGILFCGQGEISKLETTDEIKQEILREGPVVANMVVFRDLLEYESGVYHLPQDMDYAEMIGGHAVLIEGFGVEHDQEYWLVRNSWGPEWGLHGYFKIKIGESFLADQGAYSCSVKKVGNEVS